MRILVLLAFWLWPGVALCQDWEDRRLFGAADAPTVLRIISSTDTSFFVPIIEEFTAASPDVAVEYLVTGTADLDRVFRASPETFDLAISSAMDLQLKLTNDGLARRIEGLDHPVWAVWRQSLFGFTTEPAAIVIRKAAFAGMPLPQGRQDLIDALRAQPNRFRGRIGTYDVRQSGLGYLFATQDARASETFWRLMEVMGGLGTQLYCCSGDMIDDLVEGRIAVAYNVLGSYAAARAQQDDSIEIILPSDFPTTMMRTALVSRSAPHPDQARQFLAHLIRFQAAQGGKGTLPPLDTSPDNGAASAIALEPALMTYLDTLKRRTFLQEWTDAVIQAN
ncbi:ABC transporter substrate-binding protein [Sulfitobacter sp. S190]|uniref:ABC transporter substrate-binding protein n=1 Tax=Sulfitobacter sp. S190 TaxID=2867022 RepID=UPI0021A30563|nr:extracellular solute-binding protein [Sulfitobacter sp. S190]UWR21859.1 ABC transporter substrate-binding protein [Sulfitobacter sp. S190]